MNRRYLAVLGIIVIIGISVTVISLPLTRVLFSDTDMEISLYPDYLYDNFTVAETDTGLSSPVLVVQIDVDRKGSLADFEVHLRVYPFTPEQFFAQSINISEFGYPSVAGAGFSHNPPSPFELTLNNSASPYFWVFWVGTETVPTDWTVDLIISLKTSII
ncbi:MAG: hypothetical protein ACXADC_13830 [Candidatus Thorarchaeota archaeon]